MNSDISSLWSLSPSPSRDPSWMENGLLIRPATVEDAASLADVLTSSFHGYGGIRAWFTPLLRLGVYEDIQSRLRQPKPHHCCFVACLPTSPRSVAVQVVGTVEVSVRYVRTQAIAPSRLPYISNLAVKPEYRRQGIARKLLQRCDAQVKKWNYGSIVLHVLDNNHAAQQLYLRCGYDIQYTETTLGSLLLQRPRRLFLQKSLSP